jgi:superkiller protein 3
MPSPSAVRRALEQQVQGAFDPASGDRRVQTLSARLRLDPQDAEARLDLARLYESYNMAELAQEQYLRAFNLDPESASALQGLVRIARAHPEQAADTLPLVRAFLDRHPGHLAALNMHGTLLDVTGDLADAERAYRQALAQQPLAAYLYNNLGLNLAAQDRLPEAIAALRRALELEPKSDVVRNNLASALVRRGETSAALRLFRDAGAAPAVAHNNLAAILLEQGQLEESRAQLIEALQATSFFPPALENLKLLVERDRQRHALPGAVPQRVLIPADWMRMLPGPPEHGLERKP